MFLVTSAYPDLLEAAEEVAGSYLSLGVTWAGDLPQPCWPGWPSPC